MHVIDLVQPTNQIGVVFLLVACRVSRVRMKLPVYQHSIVRKANPEIYVYQRNISGKHSSASRI